MDEEKSTFLCNSVGRNLILHWTFMCCSQNTILTKMSVKDTDTKVACSKTKSKLRTSSLELPSGEKRRKKNWAKAEKYKNWVKKVTRMSGKCNGSKFLGHGGHHVPKLERKMVTVYIKIRKMAEGPTDWTLNRQIYRHYRQTDRQRQTKISLHNTIV